MKHSPYAYVWIRDGVLMNRMHINPVAFAVASFHSIQKTNLHLTSIETLINFGFEKSGVSCEEKMILFNEEKAPIIEDTTHASRFYTELTVKMDAYCNYIEGMPALLKEIAQSGGNNFITSAINQEVLDRWISTAQGAEIKEALTEVLGKRVDISKGRGHFQYILNTYNPKKIFFIADAPSEISMGKTLSEEFPIVPVGFGNVITASQVKSAYDTITTLVDDLELPALNEDELLLPLKVEIIEVLSVAGAKTVICDPLVPNLRRYLLEESRSQ